MIISSYHNNYYSHVIVVWLKVSLLALLVLSKARTIFSITPEEWTFYLCFCRSLQILTVYAWETWSWEASHPKLKLFMLRHCISLVCWCWIYFKSIVTNYTVCWSLYQKDLLYRLDLHTCVVYLFDSPLIGAHACACSGNSPLLLKVAHKIILCNQCNHFADVLILSSYSIFVLN